MHKVIFLKLLLSCLLTHRAIFLRLFTIACVRDYSCLRKTCSSGSFLAHSPLSSIKSHKITTSNANAVLTLLLRLGGPCRLISIKVPVNIMKELFGNTQIILCSMSDYFIMVIASCNITCKDSA